MADLTLADLKKARAAEHEARLQTMASLLLQQVRQDAKAFRYWERHHRELGTDEDNSIADNYAARAKCCEILVDFVASGESARG